MNSEEAIRGAIREKRLVQFRLYGLVRIAEPHVYGEYRGRLQILVYQIGGESRSGLLPNWRRANVDDVTELRVLDEGFSGSREPRLFEWDRLLAIAKE